MHASRKLRINSPIGWLLVEHDDEKIYVIEFADEKRAQEFDENESSDFSVKVKDQLNAYFQGKLTAFELPLAWESRGTEFQVRVWRALTQIPYGQTRSYRDIAVAAGSPRGARAVGNAVNQNPWPVIVPCHRVVAADGSIGGFAVDLGIKYKLLRLELP